MYQTTRGYLEKTVNLIGLVQYHLAYSSRRFSIHGSHHEFQPQPGICKDHDTQNRSALAVRKYYKSIFISYCLILTHLSVSADTKESRIISLRVQVVGATDDVAHATLMIRLHEGSGHLERGANVV